MTIHEFIKKRKHLIWYVRDYDKLSEAAIVESVLNFGNWEDVQTLIAILGMKKTAKIFRAKSALPRTNYRPDITHYFQQYFDTYA